MSVEYSNGKYAACQISHRRAWDAEYRRRGRLWAGAPPRVPDLLPGSSVLEIGCGNGKTLSAMLDRQWRVAALDISSLAVRLSREMAVYSPSKVDLLISDACTLPFKSNSFDAVFAFHITGHLLAPGRSRMAAEVARVLVPNGTLFFREFSVQDMRAGSGATIEERSWCRGDGVITHYFTESEVADLFVMLEPVDIKTEQWQMKIGGRGIARAEIAAEMRRMPICCDQHRTDRKR